MVRNVTSVRVRYADTDQMGFAYYAKYLEWFEIGRTELLRELGLPYARIETEGILLPVIEAYCKYLHSARYDEVLTIVSRIEEMPRARIRIDYEIRNPAEKRLAEGYTVHSFLNAAGKPVRPPRSLMQMLKSNFS